MDKQIKEYNERRLAALNKLLYGAHAEEIAGLADLLALTLIEVNALRTAVKEQPTNSDLVSKLEKTEKKLNKIEKKVRNTLCEIAHLKTIEKDESKGGDGGDKSGSGSGMMV